MSLPPSSLDIAIATFLAQLLGRHPLFDLGVQSMIRHGLLGGFWYACALFFLWLQVARENKDEVRLRVMTLITGSVITIGLTFLAASLVSWPPPHQYSELTNLFPNYIERNPTMNCFPSQSTAVYGSIAAGVYSVRKNLGLILWLALPVAVSLPRMYVGGHYFTDVVVGVALALIGYGIARYVLESRVISFVHRILNSRKSIQFVLDFLICVWILEVAVEFREVVWFIHGTRAVLG